MAYLLVPAGGGERFDVGGRKVLAINTDTPLARALLSSGRGELVEYVAGGKSRELEVVEVA